MLKLIQHKSLYSLKSDRYLVSYQISEQLLFFRCSMAIDQLKQHVGLYLLGRLTKRCNKLLLFNDVHLRQGRSKKFKSPVVTSEHLISLTQTFEVSQKLFWQLLLLRNGKKVAIDRFAKRIELLMPLRQCPAGGEENP